MSLHRGLTMEEREVLFDKSKKYLKYFFDNFTIEHDHFYDRAKKLKKAKGFENIYCPCVELMNYQLLKDNNIHCIKNDEMFWNDTGRPEHDGYTYGDFSIELGCNFYQLEVTAIYNPKEYRAIKKKLTSKLINATKYKDQGIIFLNLMDWFLDPDSIECLKKFVWDEKETKTKYNFDKVEAIFFIKHDLNYKVKKVELIQNPKSNKRLTELEELAIMYSIN